MSLMTAPVLTFPATVHAVDESGRLRTWQVAEDAATGGFVVESAPGQITHPAVWMQATKERTVVTESEAVALVERLTRA
ncbi:hypothetical protein [Cellulomonas carbonis]|uniref:Uncharacterized protein n=1 Tax=Cellulomonas carbonis T26 TaxID=947969 RepID=A0A0A0BR47_9CELL|nr:hypothetical protein [Cellulomonas carbonis]KGM09574.1 hypothetical protein N868_01445 [Cellulomonas carbonis T26]GGC07531.1 hypothetical protein GCM10010972_21030 [Cellulomonas carbonis]